MILRYKNKLLQIILYLFKLCIGTYILKGFWWTNNNNILYSETLVSSVQFFSISLCYMILLQHSFYLNGEPTNGALAILKINRRLHIILPIDSHESR